MAKGFVVNAARFDPYKSFKFHILWDGKIVMGVSKVGALKRTTEVVKHRHGGDDSHDRLSPGKTSYEGVSIERGLTHDSEFADWASRIHDWNGDALMDLDGYKKELTLEFLTENGKVAFRYFLHNCWVSEYTAIPDLDANANAIAIESMKIELEGWEKDLATKEPAA